jgi:hypothetical protein
MLAFVAPMSTPSYAKVASLRGGGTGLRQKDEGGGLKHCAEGVVMVVEPNHAPLPVGKGERVSLQFRAEDCVVLPRAAG